MKKTVKNYSLIATQKKVEELKEIAERYSDVKNYIFWKYGSLSGLQYLVCPFGSWRGMLRSAADAKRSARWI